MQAEDEEQILEQDEGQGEDDELMQAPAFEIPSDQQKIDEDCREAFQYILGVRSQKAQITKLRKKIKLNEEIELIQQKNSNTAPSNHVDISSNWMREWRDQTIKSWKCVISNIKYLLKKNQENQEQSTKISHFQYSMLQKPPLIHFLSRSLTLAKVENLLVSISEDFIEQQFQMDSKMFNLWIYALLALHQSRAEYTNFQALASVNSALQHNWKLIEQNAQKHERKQKALESIVNIVILIQVFGQHNMRKYLQKAESFLQK